jgi:hypothetical protein
MRFRCQVLVVLATVCFKTTFGQVESPYVPPSPNAAALAKQANVAVGYYSGVPQISIPIASATGQGISVPVSLDYHASGIRVRDVASSVGLGWNLNAGGAITRVVRGLPDGSKSFCGDGQFYQMYNRQCDGEVDMYFFSVPGRSGKIYLTSAGEPHAMPYQDLLIKPGIGSQSIGHWEIVDERGFVYTFGGGPTSQEESTYYLWNDTQNQFNEQETFVSTWYLKSIKSPAGTELATFSYLQGSSVEYVQYAQQGIDCEGNNETVVDHDMKVKINDPKYLQDIESTTLSEVHFDYALRTDLANAKLLTNVIVKDHLGVSTYDFRFEYDYFACFDPISQTETIHNCRLRLNSIKQNGIPLNSFVYKEYAQRNPAREEIFEDYWGYYNYTSQFSNSWYGRLPQIDGCSGLYKRPADIADVFMIKDIVSSSGGKIRFQFEPHDGFPQENVGFGGLRIKEISNLTSTDAVVDKTTYSYAGAQAFVQPKYFIVNSQNKKVRSSSSFRNLYDAGGNGGGYSTVTETFLDGSKIVRTFKNFSDYSDEDPTVGKYKGSINNLTFQGAADKDAPPFTPNTTRFWMRGLPASVEVKTQGGATVSRQEWHYVEGTETNSQLNTVLEPYDQTAGNFGFIVGKYRDRSKPVVLDHSVTYIYDQTDPAKVIESTTTYSYHTTFLTMPVYMISRRGPLSLAPPEHKVSFFYPTDVAWVYSQPAQSSGVASGIWALIDKHVIIPVERYVSLKDWNTSYFMHIGGELLTFKRGSLSQPVPLNRYYLELSSPASEPTWSTYARLTLSGTGFTYDSHYRLDETYEFDESNDVLTKVTNSSGLTKSFSWFQNALLASSSMVVDNQNKYTVNYGYNSVTGLETVTDMNSRSSHFKYDNLGRLKIIQDHDFNIISRYRYNLKNATEFAVGLSVTGNFIQNGTVQLSSTIDAETIGNTKYLWDFGDGYVNEGSSKSITHSYSSTGTYTAKLIKTNPEFGNTSTTSNVQIYQSPGNAITSYCSYLDLCITSSCSVTSTGSGGCPSLSYTWYYSMDEINWTQFGTSATCTFSPTVTGIFKLKCVATDGCSNALTSAIVTMNVFKSNPNCN